MESALILTSSTIFRRAERSSVGPLTKVGGLSMFQRTLLTLHRAGISRFIVLSAESDVLRSQIDADQRLRAEVRWLPMREFPPSDARTWEVLSGMLGGSYLVTGTGAVFPVSLIQRLCKEGLKGEPVIVFRDTAGPDGELSATNQAHRLDASEIGGAEEFHFSRQQPGGVATLEARISASMTMDLVWVPQGFIAPGWAGPQDQPQPFQAALERGFRQGQVRVLALEEDWYQEVRSHQIGPAGTTEAVTKAERILLKSLKGGLEGFVDRYFNRHCSGWLTRYLLRTSLTPNAVTVLATAIGLLAAAAFAAGGYWAGVVGALLFQFSAILDCCDGEVARLKFLESRFGEQLDVALDNVVHIALFAGIAWASYHTGWGSWALAAGALAILGNIVAFGIVQWATRIRPGLDPARRFRVDRILNHLASRDFSVVLLVLALIGHVDWFLLLAAVGSNIFWMILIFQLRSDAPVR
jgi:1L-myo-inositol 1-phosphate cytidylyltransferase / CDP-L-myo-inositol myo-inositolphosphotransferase